MSEPARVLNMTCINCGCIRHVRKEIGSLWRLPKMTRFGSLTVRDSCPLLNASPESVTALDEVLQRAVYRIGDISRGNPVGVVLGHQLNARAKVRRSVTQLKSVLLSHGDNDVSMAKNTKADALRAMRRQVDVPVCEHLHGMRVSTSPCNVQRPHGQNCHRMIQLSGGVLKQERSHWTATDVATADEDRSAGQFKCRGHKPLVALAEDRG
jgi:hypothetical protein